jgi:starch-binding outer membrane protein, SusD/RagB family
MKRYIVSILLSVILFHACQDDVLDKKPLDRILETQVWQDIKLLDAYVLNLYSRMHLPYQYKTVEPAQGELNHAESICSDESLTPHTWASVYQRQFGTITPATGGYMDYWNYNLIRDLNNFIEKSENINVNVIPEDIKKQRVAEIRLIRAYTYFQKVIRYGGVPLITKTQGLGDDWESLFVSRNSEKEIYDFIASEIDEILDDLPTDIKTQRLTKWAALALKSRAMLYAGSIAKYGQVQLDGLLGIPAQEAQKYFQMSYDASMALIPSSDGGNNQGNIFTLYSNDIKSGDLESYANNYYNLFLKENTSESIFEKHFVGLDLGHTLNRFTNAVHPRISLVNDYEMTDGSSGIINFNGTSAEMQQDLWLKKEPRFHATFRWDQQSWHEGIVQEHHAYTITKTGTTDRRSNMFYDLSDGRRIRARGNAGTDISPFAVKKLTKDVFETANNLGDQPAILFRLGEIYLNCAEAAYELGKADEALHFTNGIRKRAGGINLHASIDMEKIRRERRIELAFEALRFWDMKRWRIAHKTLDEGGLNGHVDHAFAVFDLRDEMYHFIYNPKGEANPRVFRDAYYYIPIGIGRTTNNPNLLENPGY